MNEYRCLVISAEGRRDWRLVEAPSESGAVAHLMADGLTPIDVRSGAMSLGERLSQPIRIGRRLGLAEQSLLLNQLAMLVRSGLPVDRSLDLLREQAPRAGQRDLLAQALLQVRAGHGLATALERQDAFPDYVVGVIRAAETAGRLGPALKSLAERMTVASATRRQLVTALTYPAAILAATLAALILVLIVVVPQFEPVFAGGEARLPTLTRFVLALSALVNDRGPWLLAALLGLPLILAAAMRSDVAMRLLENHRHRVPGLALRDQYLAGQFVGVLGTLVGNDVAVIRALPLARTTISSWRWRRHIGEVEQFIREGGSLSRGLAAGGLVPSTAVRLIEVGERTGRLADTCLQASEIMGDAARARIDRIVSLANPIAIMGLGGVVALLIGGVMLGIFALGDFAG